MLNKVILIGHLGRDPEIRYTPGNLAIGNISVATTDRRKTKDGNWEKETEWHQVVLFGKLAEIAGEYLKKGSKVYIEGKIKKEKYTDKNGVEKYSFKILGNSLQMLDSLPQSGSQKQQNQQNYLQDEHQRQQNRQQSSSYDNNFIDDDCPF